MIFLEITFEIPSIFFTSKTLSATLTNSGVIEHEIKMTSQPAQINLTLGGTSYVAFVDDISKQQDINISLQRKRM